MLLVSRQPTLLPHAEHIHNECGPYQLRAVLSAFGKDAPITDLYFNISQRKRDWSLPYFMPAVLRRFGIQARTRFWFAGSFKKRALDALRHDRSVLFVLHSIHGNHGLHWLSIWGYDKMTDEFLCYDSQAGRAEHAPGNARYSASLLARHFPWFGTFAVEILQK